MFVVIWQLYWSDQCNSRKIFQCESNSFECFNQEPAYNNSEACLSIAPLPILSVTDLIWWKNKEILVILLSILSVYKIQTFNNANWQILRKKQSDTNATIIFQTDWEQKGNKSNTTKIVKRLCIYTHTRPHTHTHTHTHTHIHTHTIYIYIYIYI